jgi:hypothetical protein
MHVLHTGAIPHPWAQPIVRGAIPRTQPPYVSSNQLVVTLAIPKDINHLRTNSLESCPAMPPHKCVTP